MLITISHDLGIGKPVLELRFTTNHALHSFLSDIPSGESLLTERLHDTLRKFVADSTKDVDIAART